METETNEVSCSQPADASSQLPVEGGETCAPSADVVDKDEDEQEQQVATADGSSEAGNSAVASDDDTSDVCSSIADSENADSAVAAPKAVAKPRKRTRQPAIMIGYKKRRKSQYSAKKYEEELAEAETEPSVANVELPFADGDDKCESTRSSDENVESMTASTKSVRKYSSVSSEVVGADKFCWICHKEGSNMLKCVACPRVYHSKCHFQGGLPEGAGFNASTFHCPECSAVLKADNVNTRSPVLVTVNLEQLCTLLQHIICILKSQKDSHYFWGPVDTKEFPHYREYVVYPMDLSMLEKNIKNEVYGCTEAFLADIKWIVHNSIVFNSSAAKITNVAKNLLKICKREILEVETCAECYYNSLVRKDTWFIEVCKKPHLLVWARLKGYPPWPAKALKCKDGMVDCRFFGAHDKAWVPLKDCYLYSKIAPQPVKLKKGSHLESGIQELEKHIKKLKDKFGIFVYPAARIPYRPSQEVEQLRMMLPNYNPNNSSRPTKYLIHPDRVRNDLQPKTLFNDDDEKAAADEEALADADEKRSEEADGDANSAEEADKTSDSPPHAAAEDSSFESCSEAETWTALADATPPPSAVVEAETPASPAPSSCEPARQLVSVKNIDSINASVANTPRSPSPEATSADAPVEPTETADAIRAASKSPSEAVSPAATLPETQVSPQTQVVASKTQVVAPKTQVVAPKTQVDAPKTQVVSPKTQEVAPKTQVVSPKTQEVAPKTQVVSPKTQVDAPKTQLVAPKTQVVSPKTQVVSPKTQVVSPKTQVVAPKTQVVSPKTQDVTPKTQIVSPKMQDISPKTQIVSSKTQVVTPKTQVVTLKTQVATPSTQVVSPKMQVVTPEQQVVASELQVFTPEPQVVTPEPPVIAPKPQVVAPEPQVVTPEPQAITPESQVVTTTSDATDLCFDLSKVKDEPIESQEPATKDVNLVVLKSSVSAVDSQSHILPPVIPPASLVDRLKRPAEVVDEPKPAKRVKPDARCRTVNITENVTLSLINQSPPAEAPKPRPANAAVRPKKPVSLPVPPIIPVSAALVANSSANASPANRLVYGFSSPGDINLLRSKVTPTLLPVTSTVVPISRPNTKILPRIVNHVSQTNGSLTVSTKPAVTVTPSRASPKFNEPYSEFFNKVMNECLSECHSQFRRIFESTLEKLINKGDLRARIVALKKEMDVMKRNHELVVDEMRRDYEVQIAELRATSAAKSQFDLAAERVKLEQEKERAVKEAKSKQWCSNCQKIANYYCCWNTAYCDFECQKEHWIQHMHVCKNDVKKKAAESSENEPPRIMMQSEASNGYPMNGYDRTGSSYSYGNVAGPIVSSHPTPRSGNLSRPRNKVPSQVRNSRNLLPRVTCTVSTTPSSNSPTINGAVAQAFQNARQPAYSVGNNVSAMYSSLYQK